MKFKVISFKYPELEEVIQQYNLSESDELCSAGMYFHGKLQDDCGHDMFVILNVNELPVMSSENEGEKDVRFIDYEGKLDVEVYGNPKPCSGYIWKPLAKSNIRKALIFYADDKESDEYAYKNYEKKSFII